MLLYVIPNAVRNLKEDEVGTLSSLSLEMTGWLTLSSCPPVLLSSCPPVLLSSCPPNSPPSHSPTRRRTTGLVYGRMRGSATIPQR